MRLSRAVLYTIIGLVALLVIAIIVTTIVAATTPDQPFFGIHRTPGGFLVMAIWMVFFWAVVIGGVILLVVWLSGQRQPPGVAPPEDPREIVRRRYARGEIDREEYERLLRDLER